MAQRTSIQEYRPTGIRLGHGLQYLSKFDTQEIISAFGKKINPDYSEEKFAVTLDKIVNWYFASHQIQTKPLPTARAKHWQKIENACKTLLEEFGLPADVLSKNIYTLEYILDEKARKDARNISYVLYDDLSRFISRHAVPENVMPDDRPSLIGSVWGMTIDDIRAVARLRNVANGIARECKREADKLPKRKNSAAVSREKDEARNGLLRALVCLKKDAFLNGDKHEFVSVCLKHLRKKGFYSGAILSKESLRTIIDRIGPEGPGWVNAKAPSTKDN